jgi:hypothetical protein
MQDGMCDVGRAMFEVVFVRPRLSEEALIRPSKIQVLRQIHFGHYFASQIREFDSLKNEV